MDKIKKMNKVKATKKPVVISIGGQDIEQIDQIVNFFQTYTKNFVIQQDKLTRVFINNDVKHI